MGVQVKPRRTSRFGHLYSHCSTDCGSFMHSGLIGLAGRFNKWTYAVSSGVCPDRKSDRLTAYAQSELVVLSFFQV